jgi:hypothetical protein
MQILEMEQEDRVEFNKLLPTIQKWSEENGNDLEKVSEDMWKMFRYKSIICRMIPDLMGESGVTNSNEAVPLLASLLNCILTITSQQDQEYSWNALDQLNQICIQITQDTGTLAEQFEMMIQTASLEKLGG